MKSEKFWCWLFLGAVFLCVLLLNIFSVPGHDGLAYAFAGQSTPTTGCCSRVSSLMDIVRQQRADYLNANGRVLIHGLVAVFAGFRLYYVFDVINAFMWMLFVRLLMQAAKINRRRLVNLVVCHGLAYLFLWYSEVTFMNAAFAVNYLWMGVLTLLMTRIWRGRLGWKTLPLMLFYGFTHEAFVLPFVVSAAFSLLYLRWFDSRVKIRACDVLGIALTLPGLAFLTFGAGATKRAANSFADVSGAVMTIVKSVVGGLIAIWPAVLISLLVLLVWRNRRRALSFLAEDIVYWAYVACSFGLFLLACRNGLYRILFPGLLFAFVLVLKNRRQFYSHRKFAQILSVASLVFLCLSVPMQILAGVSTLRCLDRYRRDSQGVTYREIVPLGPFFTACSQGIYCYWHTSLWRLEYGKPNAPIWLSEWLYENLYLTDRYFEDAVPLGSGCYIHSRAPNVIVSTGDGSSVTAGVLERSKTVQKKRVGPFGRFVPGRINYMFPPDWSDVILPKEGVKFSSKSGKDIAICYTCVP